MEIKQLEYFIALERIRNYSRASVEMNISQSSLSKHIKSLEAETGAALFVRNAKGVELTTEGQIFLVFAKEVIKQRDLLEQELKIYSEKFSTVIKFGTMPVLEEYGLTDMIYEYVKAHPQVRLEIQELYSDPLFSMLEKNEIRFAVFWERPLDERKYARIPLYTDELVLVTSKKNPLSNLKSAEIGDLSDEKFIMINDISGICQLVNDICSEAGFSPDILSYHTNVSSVLSLVARDMGISLMYERNVKRIMNKDIRIIKLSKKYTTRLVLVYNKLERLSPIEKEFLADVKVLSEKKFRG